MGKLEKIGRSILKKLSTRGSSRRRREEATSTSSDEETPRDQGFVHSFQVIPPEEEEMTSEDVRMGSPAASDEGSAGYATDDTALSSLGPLDIKRVSVDYSESQGYISNAELSPIPRIEITVPPDPPTVPTVTIPRIVGVTVPERTPLYTKKQEYPRIDIRNKNHPIYKSSQQLHQKIKEPPIERSATLSNLTEEEDPIDRFMKSHIYKTKMITTVFEAKDRGFEEISLDVCYEIDRWFESKNMMAVACELHWSVPREKRSRQLECKLKEKLLTALRENNKRLLYLRGMGHGKTPVKLAESNTVENIARDRDTDSVRGIYQRSYTRLLPYLHKETPEWHSQYWTLQDLHNDTPDDATSTLQPNPQKFLFDSEPADVLARNSLISLNIIGLSILGNSRKSCGSLFLQ
uniref:Histone domain-containing protein n=1 Tax=Caenorhabditis tropicalis TaxID=1561998 RepID=A0A1I7TQD3_9PELO